MMDRQKGNIIFECDGCSAVLDAETGNFDGARAALKEEGWASIQVDNVWQHYCKTCGRPSWA